MELWPELRGAGSLLGWAPLATSRYLFLVSPWAAGPGRVQLAHAA